MAITTIPEIPKEQNIWLVRTKGGSYYNDFTVNKYIALGWDKISRELIVNSSMSNDSKKEKISKLYPDEKRPGLIFGQLYNFYCVMKKGDLVLISSEGSKFFRVGILGDEIAEISHKKDSENEYVVCSYKHKKSVKWIAEIDVCQDVYLSKFIKVQHAISNITEYSGYIYRNIYSCYIVEDQIHLSLQKTSTTQFGMRSNVELQSIILDTIDLCNELYNGDNNLKDVVIKTAVGSPGFLEIILTSSIPTFFSALFIVNSILGKFKDSDGNTRNGIIGLIDEINKLLNDHTNRKKIAAETKAIQENYELDKELKRAQIEKVKAETRKINIECDEMNKVAETNVLNCATSIVDVLEEKGENLKRVADKNGISCHDNEELAS